MSQLLAGRSGALRSVGIAEMAVSVDAGETLVTYSLGSCVGVTLYDPQACVGGLIHCMLPISSLEPEKARAKPGTFVDTGLVALIQGVLDAGAEMSRLVVKLAGAASPMDACGRFKIGERNIATVRKVLWKNSLLLRGELTGGTQPRTMSLHMRDGRTTIRSGGQEVEL